MKKKVQLLCAALTFAAILTAAAAPAFAQRPFIPPNHRPTFSPWFGLFQQNTGALPNYLQFVRPEQRLVDTLQTQSNSIEDNNQGIRGLQQEIRDPRRAMGRKIPPTGAQSVFMDLSHYYPMQRKAALGRQR